LKKEIAIVLADQELLTAEIAEKNQSSQRKPKATFCPGAPAEGLAPIED
jgi:hypothetical protein